MSLQGMHRRCVGAGSAIITASLVLGLGAVRPAVAQQPAPPPTSAPATSSDDTEEPPRYLDTVTVSATLSPSSVRETPGTISVIDAAAVERRLVESIADLVKFEPGVYVETNPTGVGLNGFNIRGIGGNRVMTQIDGVKTAEQYDFGPFNMHQIALDLDTLASAEIVRGAASSLYGSDALGGVVSFFTKDPTDYLRGRSVRVAGKAVFDGRTRGTSGNVVIAGGRDRAQASLFVSRGFGHALANRGTVRTEDATRTAPNDQDRTSTQVLGRLVVTPTPGQRLRGTVEVTDSDIDTHAFTSQGAVVSGPSVTQVSNVMARDRMRRQRYSIAHDLPGRGSLVGWHWNAYLQHTDQSQVINEVRAGATTIDREGSIDYSQHGFGAAVQARQAFTPAGGTLLMTYGAAVSRDRFDVLRDRTDVDAATGVVVPAPPTSPLPTKYFPLSDVTQSGAYVQGDLRIGAVRLLPGLRYDRFSLDADQDDRIYLDSFNPVPEDFSAGALSSKIGVTVDAGDRVTFHAQYAGGFRAPSYNAINSGFTNLQGRYTALPNPDLRAETSDSFEFGVRGGDRRLSLGATGFVNLYDDFIDLATLGVNPATGLLEFRNENLAAVTIRGVELQADAVVSDTLRLRASYAVIRGHDVSGDEDQPLTSIAPDQGAIGVQFDHASRRWGGEAVLRGAHGQSVDRVNAGDFTPSAYAVVDVTAWMQVQRDVVLRAGILNLTNATYYEWASVRGRAAADPAIARYTSPGISGVVSLGYGW